RSGCLVIDDLGARPGRTADGKMRCIQSSSRQVAKVPLVQPYHVIGNVEADNGVDIVSAGDCGAEEEGIPALAAVERVVARPTLQLVLPVSAVESVVALAAVERVIAARAPQRVVARSAPQRVIARAANHGIAELVTGERQALCPLGPQDLDVLARSNGVVAPGMDEVPAGTCSLDHPIGSVVNMV